MQLALEDGGALDELGVAAVFRIKLGLAARLSRLEASGPGRAQLRSSRRQHRAEDALLAEHSFHRPELTAGKAGVRLLHDPQLLCGAEHSPRASVAPLDPSAQFMSAS